MAGAASPNHRGSVLGLNPRPPFTFARVARTLLLVVYAVATALLAWWTAEYLVPFSDWNVWVQVAGRLAEDRLYDHSDPAYSWGWSPLAAWLIAYIVVPIGPWLWAAAHFVALAALREWRLIGLVALSYPFWMDTLMANAFVFSAVAGFAAWRGSRLAALIYIGLFVLMPRPVLVPLACALLWRDRRLWLPSVLILGIGVVTTIASGYASDWVRFLVGIGIGYPSQEFNLSPTRLVGPAWLAIGVPLAAWLSMRGQVGWAGLAMSPYVVPQYLLILLLELPGWRRNRTSVQFGRSLADAGDRAPTASPLGS
jgi:hypothetical protein